MLDQWYHFKKVWKDKRFSVTIRELCDFSGINVDDLSPQVKKILGKKVSQVSAVQPTFVSNSICAQMYDDTDDDMRWAVKMGAMAVVTTSQIDDLPCIVHPNPPMIYAQMCRYYRQLRDIPVTAVTGSIGKTTVKLMINSVYKEHFNCFCNTINYNALYHAGYYVQHIPQDAQIMIQEVSEDTPNYVAPISICLCPHIAVITKIDKSHYEAFGTDDKICEEVCSIVKGMSENDYVVVNKDDFTSYDMLEGKKVVSISSTSNEADFFARDIRQNDKGLSFTVVEKETGHTWPVQLKNIYANHNVGCALQAFAAGVLSHVPYEKIVRGLESYRTLGMRQNIFEVPGGILVYADCFNAVPLSIKTAVEATCDIPVKGKRVAVLGDIEECGELTQSVHREIIDIVSNSSLDVLLAYGKKLNKALDDYPNPFKIKTIRCSSHEDIITNLKSLLSEGDIVLFKASHSAELRGCIKKLWPETYSKVNNDERDPYNKWIKMVRKN